MRPTHKNSAERWAIGNEKRRRKMLGGGRKDAVKRQRWEGVGKRLIAEELEHCSFSCQMIASVPSSRK